MGKGKNYSGKANLEKTESTVRIETDRITTDLIKFNETAILIAK
jgi:hypothetical protein